MIETPLASGTAASGGIERSRSLQIGGVTGMLTGNLALRQSVQREVSRTLVLSDWE